MWVAHLFSDKDRTSFHRSPEFCNGSDLQPTRTYCRTALHARSQGAVIGQGSVAEAGWRSHKAPVQTVRRALSLLKEQPLV